MDSLDRCRYPVRLSGGIVVHFLGHLLLRRYDPSSSGVSPVDSNGLRHGGEDDPGSGAFGGLASGLECLCDKWSRNFPFYFPDPWWISLLDRPQTEYRAVWVVRFDFCAECTDETGRSDFCFTRWSLRFVAETSCHTSASSLHTRFPLFMDPIPLLAPVLL